MFDAVHHSGEHAGRIVAPVLVRASVGQALTLAQLDMGTTAVVTGTAVPGNEADGELVRRLLEIGFVAGEPVRVVAHGSPGRDPIAVRLGGTTFALRRHEAEFVLIDTGRHARSG